MSRYVSVTFLVLSMFLAGSSAAAAEDRAAHDDLAEMNATLKEIARTLRQQAETQKADLLLKRVMLATTQLANAQDRLNRIDRELSALDAERLELENQLASQKEAGPSGDAPARARETKSRWQSVQDRLSALRQERGFADNDISALRREARDWQTLLDKTLTSGS